jgi:hypothetical protein
MFSFQSPCVLPVVSVYLAYVAGTDLGGVSGRRWRGLLIGAFFVLDFSRMFITMRGAATEYRSALLEPGNIHSRRHPGGDVGCRPHIGVLCLPRAILRDWLIPMP